LAFASDNFDGGTGGTSIGGRTSSGGQTWTANLDQGHVGDVVLYPTSGTSTKAGSKPSGADSSCVFALTAAPATPDYGVDFTFEFGTNVAGKVSLGPIIRFQETVVSPQLHFYGAAYNANVNRWEITINNGAGVGAIGTYSQTYASGTTLNYTLRACGSTIELIEAGVTIISVTDTNITLAGQAGIFNPSAGSAFSGTNGWWITNFEANDGSCTQGFGVDFGLYFAGSGLPNGEDFSPVVYGLPTPVTIASPQPGFEYTVAVNNPVDLANFTSGLMGNIKLRRSGVQDTHNVVLRGISLQYKKKAT
jgi:hypothetical protein